MMPGTSGQPVEGGRVIAQRGVLRVGEDTVAGAAIHVDQPIRVGDREAPEQRRVHQAVDRRVRADAECQGEHRGSGESLLLPQHPSGVAQVVQDVPERPAPRRPCQGRRWRPRLAERPHLAGERVVLAQLVERQSQGVGVVPPLREELRMAVVEMLRELVDDLRFTGGAQAQRRQPRQQVLAPVRHDPLR
jgi:hypothetical protein